jgi:hypothetical protein
LKKIDGQGIGALAFNDESHEKTDSAPFDWPGLNEVIESKESRFFKKRGVAQSPVLGFLQFFSHLYFSLGLWHLVSKNLKRRSHLVFLV